MNTTPDIAALRGKLEALLQVAGAATPGPWLAQLHTWYNGSPTHYVSPVLDEKGYWPVAICDKGVPPHNARFIAASRTICPVLLRDMKDRLEYWGGKLLTPEEYEHYEQHTASRTICPVLLRDMKDRLEYWGGKLLTPEEYEHYEQHTASCAPDVHDLALHELTLIAKAVASMEGTAE